MKWKEAVIIMFNKDLKKNNINYSANTNIHLAVFNEPFLSLLMDNQKTIESRFSINKIAPYGKIKQDDIVIIKKSAGPVVGYFTVGDVKFYNNLDKKDFCEIEESYGKSIGTNFDELFWEKRERANYCSLISVSNIVKTSPYFIPKKDRSGWSLVKSTVNGNYEINEFLECH